MKRLFTTIVLACCHPLLAAEESSIRFVNGDHVTGSLASLDAEQIVWDSPLFEQPARFFTGQVLSVIMPSRLPQNQDAGHEATITLTNGDKIRGQLAEVTEKHVILDTWYAGRLTLNRLMVEDASVDEPGKVLYRGPNSMDGWICHPRTDPWKYSAFAFHCAAVGSVARADALADSSSVSFDTEWDNDSLRLKVVLFSQEPETTAPKSGCEISINRGSIIIRNCADQSFLGSMHSQVLAQSNRARIEIRANRTTGKVAVFINGKLLDIWQNEDFRGAEPGTTLHFIAEEALSMRISRIRIAEWDGEIDQPVPARAGFRRFQFGGDMPPATEPAEEEEPTPGRMKLANGDSLEGKVTSIRDGKVTIETTLGSITLPVNRLRTVSLPPSPREEAFRENRDVRAWMPDGASIVFRFDSADKDTITGSSDNFGTATFRRDAFQRIDFNIHDIDYDDLRKESNW